MASEKSDAIVIRMVEFSETSLIVTLYTRDFGRVSAIAKGARRPKGPFEGAIDLLAICHIEIIRKASDALDLLTEVKLARRFRAAQKSLDRLYCGYYIAELLRRWTDDGEPHPELYELAIATIQQIDSDADHLMATVHFEVRGLRMLGHAPATQSCVSCGSDVARDRQRIPFGHDVGGVLCPSCHSRNKAAVTVHRDALDWLDRLNEAQSPPQGPFANENYRQIRALLNRYITVSLGSRPRTQSMLPTKLPIH